MVPQGPLWQEALSIWQARFHENGGFSAIFASFHGRVNLAHLPEGSGQATQSS